MDDRYLDQPYALAGRSIDPVGGTVAYNGQYCSLNRKQLEVLALLASRYRTVSRDELITQAWGGDELIGNKNPSNIVIYCRIRSGRRPSWAEGLEEVKMTTRRPLRWTPLAAVVFLVGGCASGSGENQQRFFQVEPTAS